MSVAIEHGGMDERELLKRLGCELWGDEFRVVEHHWSDGDVSRFVEHLGGIVDEDDCGKIRVRERLFVDEAGERFHVRREQYRNGVVGDPVDVREDGVDTVL